MDREDPGVCTASIDHSGFLVNFYASNVSFQVLKTLNQSSMLRVPSCKLAVRVTGKEDLVVKELKRPDETLLISVLNACLSLFSLFDEVKLTVECLQVPFTDRRVLVTCKYIAFIRINGEADAL